MKLKATSCEEREFPVRLNRVKEWHLAFQGLQVLGFSSEAKFASSFQ